jgi:hypothetical protein
MDKNQLNVHYIVESGKSLIKVSNLLIIHIIVSVLYGLILIVSLEGGNPDFLSILYLLYLMFSLVVLGMSIYSIRESGINLVKSVQPNYHPSGVNYSIGTPYPQTSIVTETQPSTIKPNLVVTDDGVIERYRKNGNLHSRERLKNEIRDGVYESYDESGVLESITTYKNGIKEGLFERYFVNGTVYERGTYVKNNLRGEYQIFTYDGKLKKTKHY